MCKFIYFSGALLLELFETKYVATNSCRKFQDNTVKFVPNSVNRALFETILVKERKKFFIH